MAKTRSIYPVALGSDKLAQVGAEAERLYWRLMTQCDDEGRCEDHPRKLWAACFPVHEDIGPDDVDVWLWELDAVRGADLERDPDGLIVRYTVDRRRYLEVTQWRQKPRWAKPSEIPPASDGCRTPVGQESDGSRIPDGISSSREVARKRERLGEPFSTDFEATWQVYPRKEARKAAFKAYQARRREGIPAETLHDATVRFKVAMVYEHREAKLIKLGSTFYGPDEHWKDYLEPPPEEAPAPAIEAPPPAARCPTCGKLEIDCVCQISRDVQPRFKDALTKANR